MEPKEFDIEFPRGNTCLIEFNLLDKTKKNPLILTNSDELYFTVKNNSNTTEIKLQKKFSLGDVTQEADGTCKIMIETEDTNNWKYGSYEYDICVESGNYRKTIGIGKFTVTKVITF